MGLTAMLIHLAAFIPPNSQFTPLSHPGGSPLSYSSQLPEPCIPSRNWPRNSKHTATQLRMPHPGHRWRDVFSSPSENRRVSRPCSMVACGLYHVPATLLAALVGASVVNALQGGVKGYKGETQSKILGVSAEEATAVDVERLDKAGFMQLFYASPCPSAGDLEGEYFARALPMGVLHPVASFITNWVWGPGRWLGKAVHPCSSEGYNIFESRVVLDSEEANSGWAIHAPRKAIVRTRWFGVTNIDGSVFDGGNSMRFNYGRDKKNGLLFGGMRDEVRMVNPQLFIGLGYIIAFGGRFNTAPFILQGSPVSHFVNVDVQDSS
ncbi:unnamed protein product [Choristocarpus tenellus]